MTTGDLSSHRILQISGPIKRRRAITTVTGIGHNDSSISVHFATYVVHHPEQAPIKRRPATIRLCNGRCVMSRRERQDGLQYCSGWINAWIDKTGSYKFHAAGSLRAKPRTDDFGSSCLLSCHLLYVLSWEHKEGLELEA